ncbi:hypothetical protein K7711_33035 [Nocardia sp. CA2R105]|uniref:hypothetical protein n=1 Tax=Nocardia coffeae TaxID=2873381 RepID=UPI001CA67014|nr:hypothetical protein [Nocardia coffeae]MBY8861341.1 hypothetical protein [Nocardia coffeae]
MKARTFVGVAVAAVAVSMAGTAGANAAPPSVDVTPYLVGTTAYFSVDGANCSIESNGDVGCDIPAGMAKWYNVIPVTDLAIDLPVLPAHPTFGLFGQHGRAGSPVLPEGDGYGSTISYAGATCSGGGRGAISCSSKGHSFSFGWSGTQTS